MQHTTQPQGWWAVARRLRRFTTPITTTLERPSRAGRRILGALLAAVLVLTAMPPLASATPDPLACTGYKEKRAFVEVQDWWRGEPLEKGQVAHVHAGTCFPVGRRVSGRLILDVRLMLHDNPGHLYRIEASIFGTDARASKALDLRCSDMDCMWWRRLEVPTRKVTRDGWFTLRLKARVRQSNGKLQLTSTDWPIYIKNDKRLGGNGGINGLVSRGWYEKHGYQQAAVANARVFNRRLRGTVKFVLRLGPGADGLASAYTAVYLDPDFHNPNPRKREGIVLFEKDGPTRKTLEFDTTKVPNGVHRLVFRSTSKRSFGGRNTGVMSVTVRIRN